MTGTTVSYLICTTPRTGSWLLCDVLAQTGLAGFPQEYLMSHTAFDPAWGIPRKETLPDYLAWVRSEATGDNGVCGIKLHWSQLLHLERVLELGPAEVLGYLGEHLPGLVLVRLSRLDTLRQAISYHRAIVEQQWWQLAGDGPARRGGWSPDFAEVARLQGLLVHHAQGWADLLRDGPWPTRHVTYEQLVADTARCAVEVLDLLGVAEEEAWPAASAVVPTLQRQSDLQTELHVHGYLSWLHAPDQTDDLEPLEAIS